MYDPACVAYDAISAVIITNVNMDILLIPVTMKLMNLSLEQAREALFCTWLHMGACSRRTALLYRLSDIFIKCSRRVWYRGLSLYEAQEKALTTITVISTTEARTFLEDYLETRPRTNERQTNHECSTEGVPTEIADAPLTTPASDRGVQVSFEEFQKLLRVYNYTIAEARQFGARCPSESWPWGGSPNLPAGVAYELARANKGLAGVGALLKSRTKWYKRSIVKMEARLAAAPTQPKPEAQTKDKVLHLTGAK
jgi:hypothetical protein